MHTTVELAKYASMLLCNLELFRQWNMKLGHLRLGKSLHNDKFMYIFLYLQVS